MRIVVIQPRFSCSEQAGRRDNPVSAMPAGKAGFNRCRSEEAERWMSRSQKIMLLALVPPGLSLCKSYYYYYGGVFFFTLGSGPL